jgi:hypothetical protein
MPYLDYASDLPAGQDVQVLLARANDFSPSDLSDNRAGRLSNRQMVRLLARALLPPRAAWVVMGLWALLVFSLHNYAPAVELRLARVLGSDVIGVPGAVILTGLIAGLTCALLLMSRQALQSLLDVVLGQAAETTGRIYPSFEEEDSGLWGRLRQNSGRRYYYVIQRERFEVTAVGHASTPTGMLCRVHFAPRSRVLLSIEAAAIGARDAAHAEAFSWKPGQPAPKARSATAK